MTWRLITIRPSHYNEKARWALDRLGLEYDEEPWMPMFHMLGAGRIVIPHRIGSADKQSSRFSMPILVTETRTLTDSTDIVGFASAHVADPARSLAWSTEMIELSRHFSGRFGADTRRLAYHYLLPDNALLEELAHRSVGRVQARAWIAGLPLIKQGVIKSLRITAKGADTSRQRVLDEFAAVDQRLADGRKYLGGDRFSVADLSFAAMGAFALLVQPSEGYGAWVPSLEQVSSECSTLARQMRATPAGEFILRMFAEERGTRIRPCSVP